MKKLISLLFFAFIIISVQSIAFGQWYVAQSNGSSFAQFTKWADAVPNGGTRMVGDVTGDGKADVVSFNSAAGTWDVSRSTGKKFEKAKTWVKAFGNGMTPLLGDVNGDGKMDAVAYNSANGEWYASVSTGSKFSFNTAAWISGHGVGSTNQFLADVNGDRKADAIIFHPAQGLWYVAISTGNGFNKDSEWAKGHGIGSNGQYVGDVDGDGRADAIVFFNQGGKWYVAPSNGNSFGSFMQWTEGNAIGSNARFIGDLDGDRRADPAWFYVSLGDWYSARSQGMANIGSGYVKWISGHGINSSVQFLADTTGDGRADAIIAF